MSVLYRYDIRWGVYPKLQLREYKIIKETPKGVWISIPFKKDKFVLLTARKKWACLTPEEAMDSFRWRKFRQAQYVLSELRDVKEALDIAGIKYKIEYGSILLDEEV